MRKTKNLNQGIIAVIILVTSIIISLGIIFYFNPNIINEIKTQYYEYQREKALEEFAEEYIKKHQQKYNEMVKAHKEFEKEQKRIQNLLKKDHYGGKTPEETLSLFIEALKNKDYKLAAKYYVPWKWEEMEKKMKEVVSNEYNRTTIIKAYEYGKIYKREGVVNLYLYMKRPDEKYPYMLKMYFNNKTGVWKIEEF